MSKRCTIAPAGAAAIHAAQLCASIPQIETARLILRAPQITDLSVWTPAYLAEWAQDGETEERAWEAFSYYTACWILHGHGLWTAVNKASGQVVGFVLLGLEWDDDEPELGYIIAEDHRRQGYGYEACKAARDHGLALLGSGTFVSYVEPKNAASNAMAVKLGAARDAVTEAELDENIHVWRHHGKHSQSAKLSTGGAP